MQDLSLHILDLIQNSIAAGASLIKLTIYEDKEKNWLTIDIEDNGKGMDKMAMRRAADPFYTTRSTRKVGLGLPLFVAMAQRCGGDVVLKSTKGKGTSIKSGFQLNHIDISLIGTYSISGNGQRSAIIYALPSRTRMASVGHLLMQLVHPMHLSASKVTEW
jgi:hypothetical protein